VSHAAAVPDLQINPSTGEVHSLRNSAPRVDLIVSVDAWSANDAMPLIGYLRALSDD
jgi:hypothetical protein